MHDVRVYRCMCKVDEIRELILTIHAPALRLALNRTTILITTRAASSFRTRSRIRIS